MDSNNKYTKMQRDYYNATADIMAIENHRGHDSNPDYYNVLLKDIIENSEGWKDAVALDFGCGIGRNVDNLLRLAKWKRVDGCDISSENIIRASNFLNSCQSQEKFQLTVTTGTSLHPLEDNLYNFIMSTIVLQHIAVHNIRTALFKDIYRIMKPGGLFSFQMAQYYDPSIPRANYYDNIWNANGTNGALDVNVSDPTNLIDDLVKIGYKNITFEIRPEWDANNKCYMNTNKSNWIFVKAFK